MKQIDQLRISVMFVTALLPLASSISRADEVTPLPAVPRHEKVVFQVSDGSIAKWNLTLANARNVQEMLGKNNVDIEIVAYGPGIDLLRFESELADNIDKARDSGIKIEACENTMKSKRLAKDDMLSTIGFVPSGVVELITKQDAGWAYIRP